MTAAAPPAADHAHEYPTFGLPSGSVRGFLSVLICSFFWIVLLLPADWAITVPLGHFFLLTLVFMAFASHPLPEARVHMLPWVMRVLFVGGSVAAVALAVFQSTHLAAARLTPNPADVTQWPVLLGCLAGGCGTIRDLALARALQQQPESKGAERRVVQHHEPRSVPGDPIEALLGDGVEDGRGIIVLRMREHIDDDMRPPADQWNPERADHHPHQPGNCPRHQRAVRNAVQMM